MLVVELVWQLLKDLDTSCDLLRAKTHFTGGCYSIYYACLTVYFLERFVLRTNHSNQPKREFMLERLQSSHDVVKERYRWVTHHLPNFESSRKVRIPAGADRRYSATDYVEILGACEIASEYIKTAYSQVTRWAEQLM
jgi:hypothetical protein